MGKNARRLAKLSLATTYFGVQQRTTEAPGQTEPGNHLFWRAIGWRPRFFVLSHIGIGAKSGSCDAIPSQAPVIASEDRACNCVISST